MRISQTPTKSPKWPSVSQALVLALSAWALTACGPKYPNCEQDEDCKEAEYCVDQLCQQCRTDDQCGEGSQCNQGACEAIPGFCNVQSECGVGEDCVANRCQTASSAPEPVVEAAVSEGPCEVEHVYFDYDSANLEASARDVIARNAECTRERGYSSLQLTGHTDPRGTEEYNLALGDRRARSVRKYLESLGVGDSKVKSSSMGEEMARGEDESGWSTDRKVEFIAR